MHSLLNIKLVISLPDWLHSDLSTLGITAISALVIYVTMVVYTRLNGLRTFAKMNSFDFAVTIAIGSILASTLISKSTSLSAGMVGLGVLIVLQTLVAYMRSRSDSLERLLTNAPVLLMEGEQINYENLKKNNMSEDDLMAKLREANVIRRSEVYAVVLETTGDVSVLHGSEEDRDLEACLLQGVQKSD